MPTVSVAIPVFNGERFIGDAIQSVLDQAFRDFEIIVVDDGSTDGTEKVVRQFSGAISYHREQNQGAGVARNVGVSLAQGEWIAFLDADDIWYSQKLSVQVDYTSTHPEASFVYCDMDVIDLHGFLVQRGFLSAKLEGRKRKKRRNLVSLAFSDQPFPYPSTVLCKRELFLKTGGFSPLFHQNYHEDFDLFARMAQITPLHFIPQSLVKYRQGTKNEDRWEANWLVLLDRLSEYWRDDPERLAVVKWYVCKHYSDQGKRFLRSGDYKKARQYFRRAFSQRAFYWKNLRRWALSYVPGSREFYIYRKTRASQSER